LARRKGWLSRISSQLLGDRMARVLDMYYDLVEAVDSPDEFTQRHLPIAACTCLELFYRQVGRRVFDPKMHMHTAVNLSITPADLPELERIASLLAPADLFWIDRRIQSVEDIQSALDDMGLSSPFAGNAVLLDDTHLLYIVRNDCAHGMGTRRYARHLIPQTVCANIDAILVQLPPLLAAFRLLGGIRAGARGDEAAAAAFCCEAIKLADESNSDPSMRHVIAGKAEERLGRRGEALSRYKRAVLSDPGNAGAHAALGCLLAQEGRDEDALAEYGKAVEIEPGYANAHMGRGSILLHLGRPAEAIESYHLAALADPSNAEAHIAAGRVHLSQGRPAEAIESYRLAALADPSNAEAHIAAGRVHMSQGRPAEAIESYRLAALADPSNAEAHIAAGRVHLSQGRPAEAIESYRLAALADPSNAGAHIAAGAVHESQGRPAEAIESYRLASRTDPSSARPHIAAGRVYMSQGRPAEAIESYRLAALADPSSARPHIAAGAVHESQGRPAEAIESYRLAAQADTLYMASHVATGMLSEVLDNLPESMLRYSESVDPASAGEWQLSNAKTRVLKRRGFSEADEMIRNIKHSKRGQVDDRKG